jgi:hypothetical protein
VLMLAGYFEISEDDEKDKKIVDAERQFNDVSGDELERLGAAVPEKYQDGKRAREADPGQRPACCLAESNHTLAPIEHAQIEGEHGDDEEVEENPKEEHSEVYQRGSGRRKPG